MVPAHNPSPGRRLLFPRVAGRGREKPAAPTPVRHNIRGVSFDKFGLRSNDIEHEITAIDTLAHKHEDRVVTFAVDRPTPAQLSELEDVWDLHPLLVEDLEAKEQRAKVERYGDVLFVVVNSVVYRDSKEDIDIGEIHVLMRGNQVAILCQNQAAAEAWHSRSAQFIERWSEQDSLLEHGPEAVIHALLDSLVDDYPRVLRGLELDKEQIERQVFSGDPAVAERIYRLSREVIELQQASSSMMGVIRRLLIGITRHGYGKDEELQTYLEDVSDNLATVIPDISELRDALNQILQVNSTLVSQRQNDDMKKISGWAAILFAPTLIGAIYGMNFTNMPELSWPLGYPMAIGAMVALAVVLYVVFKKKGWM